MSPVHGHSVMDRSISQDVEQRRHRRAELRQFYGLKGQDLAPNLPGIDASSVQGADQQPWIQPDKGLIAAQAIGPVSFDELAAKSDLSGLLRSASAISTDVNNLHSSRHALVYNHHHQLFAAGDTISQLNSRTPQLLGIMSSLQQAFSEISRLADNVALPSKVIEPSISQKGKNEVERVRLTALAKGHAADEDG